MASAVVIKGGGGGSGSGGGFKVKPRPATDSKGKAVVVSKPEVKGKTVTTTVTKTTSSKSTTVRVKTEKKVYTLPGQKHDPPEEREPLRIFYESLSQQIPSSEMAEFWLMEHGLLPHDKAKRAYEKKHGKKFQVRTVTPMKSQKQEMSESSKRSQMSKNGDFTAKKRVQYSDDEDDDFLVKNRRIKDKVHGSIRYGEIGCYSG